MEPNTQTWSFNWQSPHVWVTHPDSIFFLSFLPWDIEYSLKETNFALFQQIYLFVLIQEEKQNLLKAMAYIKSFDSHIYYYSAFFSWLFW